MTILNWDKPKKAMSTKKWKGIVADGAPPGVYTPNMSQEDRLKWKAQYTKGRIPKVTIKKSTINGTQVVIVVTLSGGFPVVEDPRWNPKGIERQSEKAKVRISQNGPAFYTFQEMQDMQAAIDEAKEVLQRNEE
jgi:ribosome-associated translation inhibitor RaiA